MQTCNLLLKFYIYKNTSFENSKFIQTTHGADKIQAARKISDEVLTKSINLSIIIIIILQNLLNSLLSHNLCLQNYLQFEENKES